MSHEPSYTRGHGGLTLTLAQRDALIAVRDTQALAFETNRSGSGIGVPIYEKLREFMGEWWLDPNMAGGEWVRHPEVDEVVWTWINGAIRVNAGDGLFADFIREYTMAQYRLRGGDPANAASLNQVASNEIAFNLAAGLRVGRQRQSGPGWFGKDANIEN